MRRERGAVRQKGLEGACGRPELALEAGGSRPQQRDRGASMDQAPGTLQATGILLEDLNYVCSPSQLCPSWHRDHCLLDNRETLKNAGQGWCV